MAVDCLIGLWKEKFESVEGDDSSLECLEWLNSDKILPCSGLWVRKDILDDGIPLTRCRVRHAEDALSLEFRISCQGRDTNN